MGILPSKTIGLARKVPDFPEALVTHLGELLDEEDDTPLQLDWRTLAQRLELKDEHRRKLSRAEKKTKAALRLWSYQEPDKSTGRDLVRILIDIGRRDAALAVQSHLGERYEPGRSVLEDKFQEVDTAARFGQLEDVRTLIGGRMGPEVEEVFQACPSIMWSPLHTAAEFGHLLVVKFFVEKQFNIFTKNHRGKTPREVALEKTQKRVAAYLAGAEAERLSPQSPVNMPDSVIGQILTVSTTDQLPVDISIDSNNLDDILTSVSTQLGITASHLVNSSTRAKISSVSDFRHTREVFAFSAETNEEAAQTSNFPSVFTTDPRVRQVDDSNAPRQVLLFSFRDFWSRPPHAFPFKRDEELSSLLSRSSAKLGCQVVQLLTCDKLSRIPSSRVLACKSRAIGLDAPNEHTALDERKNMGPFKYISESVMKEFSRAGGVLFSSSHGLLLTIPDGAVREGDRVSLSMKVALPDRQMDVGDDAIAFHPVGQPVLIEVNPPGYQFQMTTSLRMPHCGVVEENVNAPICVFTASPSGSQPCEFRKLPDQLVNARDNYVTVLLSKVSWFWAFAQRTIKSRHYAVSVFSPTDEIAKQADTLPFKAFIYPALPIYYKGAVEEIRRDGESQDWILRAQRTFMSLPYDEIEVLSEGADQEIKLNPARQTFELREAWDVLYVSDHPSDHFSFKARALRPEKRKETVLSLKLVLKGADAKLMGLGLYVDVPSFGPGSDFTLPQQLKDELARLMDGEEERGWRALAERLGVNPQEVENEEKPTLAILRKFERRRGTREELQDALVYLARTA